MTDPSDLVTGPAGVNFGLIDDSVAKVIDRPSGSLCLPYGIPGPRGFGQQHVEGMDKRMKAIKALGFQTFAAYAYFVCRQYEWIVAGDKGRLILVRPIEFNDLMVIAQFNDNAAHWAISTGLPKRVQRGTKIWERKQVGRSEPSPGVVEKRLRRETLTLPKKP